MAQSTYLNNLEVIYAHKNEDTQTINQAVKDIHSQFEFCTVAKQNETGEYIKILKQTTISIKKFANSHYKASTFIEPSDIEAIKDCLENYKSNDYRVNSFKSELIEDLTDFQKEIKIKHVSKIADYNKKLQLCKKQIKVAETEKNKIVMERLSKILWPYDEKTKELDKKVATLTLQAEQLENKIKTASVMRPMANEKDILVYEFKLKEKFAKYLNQ